MLAGRRLFLGETDFATVKLVQQAEIPSLSKVNPRSRSSSSDRRASRSPGIPRSDTNRRASSAVALNEFLYRHGKAVGSFKSPTLVQSTIEDKQAAQPQMQHSIIDKLIEEALFEFTSLQDADDAPPPGYRGWQSKAPLGSARHREVPEPCAIGRARSRSRAAASPRARHPSPPQLVEAGNLAALEEDDDGPPLPVVSAATSAAVADPPPPAPDRPGEGDYGASLPASRKGSSESHALAVVLVLAVTAAALAGGADSRADAAAH